MRKSQPSFANSIGRFLMLYLVLQVSACIPPPTLEEARVRHAKVEKLLTEVVSCLDAAPTCSLSKAHALLQLAAELNPEDPRVSDGFGCIALRLGDYPLARRYFSQALQLNPRYARALGHLAFLEERLGNLHKAKELYEHALLIDPLGYQTRNNYAALILEHSRSPKELAKARKELEKADASSEKQEWRIAENLRRADRRVRTSSRPIK